MSEKLPSDTPSRETNPAKPSDTRGTDSFPYAVIEKASQANDVVKRNETRFWILTLLCGLLAVVMTWWSLPTRGLEIEIAFPEGHGLRPEDPVRFRGVQVGQVESLELSRGLDSVVAKIQIDSFAREIAREGTRFWIVRPEVSLTEVTGLDTALGSKYIEVSPAPSADGARAATSFQGLAMAPVDMVVADGIELTLQSRQRRSVRAGSGVSFRGVEIGKVLDVSLSPDARFVHVRIRIEDKFRSLLTSETKFWVSSGLDVDFSFGSGLKLDTESIETLAKGGVAMLTVAQGRPVRSGDVFDLYPKANPDWESQANAFTAAPFPMHGVTSVDARWQSRGLFGTKPASANAVALVLQDESGQVFGLFAREFIEKDAQLDLLSDAWGAAEFELRFAGKLIQQTDLRRSEINPILESSTAPTDELKWISFPVPPDSGLRAFQATSELRFESPEDLVVEAIGDCIAIRYVQELDAHFNIALGEDLLQRDPQSPQRLLLHDFGGDPQVWHGAPVATLVDGKLIGVLNLSEGQRYIETLTRSTLPQR